MNSTIKNECTIQVRVLPNAKHEGWAGVWNNTHYKIALRAPAVDGKANEALIEFLANETKLPKKSFKIVHGATNRCKTIRIVGIDKLEPPTGPRK
jgi:uncharacterized protein (TIGR00251 family)